MNRSVRGALAIAVALAAFYGVKAFKQEAFNPDQMAREAREKIEYLKERAESEHPGMAKTDALKKVAAADAAKALATETGAQRATTAAGMFWGFYWTNTEARVEYCSQRGVDLTPFTTAFTKEHASELSRATAIYTAAGVKPEALLPPVLPELSKVVVQDMIDVTTGAQVPLDQACALFNDNADQLAKLIQLPPEIKQALMSH